MYYVYAIGKKEDLMPPYNNCYIGVTNNPQGRWVGHTRSDYVVGRTIRKHSLTFDENFTILYSGNEKECFLMENKLRPDTDMGLNIASGGQGGNTGSYDNAERSKKISEAMKGRKVTWMDKILESRGSYEGSKNPQAATWVFTDPEGNTYNVVGTFQDFCDEHNLLASSLRYHKGHPVPPLEKKYGGYRAKNETSREKRTNTIGWMCEKCSGTGGEVL